MLGIPLHFIRHCEEPRFLMELFLKCRGGDLGVASRAVPADMLRQEDSELRPTWAVQLQFQ